MVSLCKHFKSTKILRTLVSTVKISWTTDGTWFTTRLCMQSLQWELKNNLKHCSHDTLHWIKQIFDESVQAILKRFRGKCAANKCLKILLKSFFNLKHLFSNSSIIKKFKSWKLTWFLAASLTFFFFQSCQHCWLC